MKHARRGLALGIAFAAGWIVHGFAPSGVESNSYAQQRLELKPGDAGYERMASAKREFERRETERLTQENLRLQNDAMMRADATNRRPTSSGAGDLPENQARAILRMVQDLQSRLDSMEPKIDRMDETLAKIWKLANEPQ